MISGIEIELGGEKYVVPPLNFKAVREHMDAIAAMTTGVPLSSEQIDRSVALILAAMRRNYPQMTQDGLEELLDMANIKIVLPANSRRFGVCPRGGIEGGQPRPVDWDALYATLIARTGWTWEYIDEHMSVPRLEAMNRQWERTPPLNEAVAVLLRAFGWKGAAKPVASGTSEAAFRNIVEETEYE